MSDQEQTKKAGKKVWILLAALLLIAMAAIGILLIPVFRQFSDLQFQEALRSWIGALGIWGWLLLLVFQMLQIIIAIIPGGPVQLLAGILYGAWGGLFLCVLGSVLASALIFMIVRRLGEKIVLKFFGENQIQKFAFFCDSQRLEIVTFLLFLIPGLPKDLLTYLAGLSNLKLSRFLILTTLARMPALAASTIVGDSASQGNWTVTIIITVIVAFTALLGVVYREKIISFLKHHKDHYKLESKKNS